MAQSVTLYNLLISCPGDVKAEVALIESAVEEFNELYAEPLGITIKTRYWGKSSYAQSGGKPQALLNEQFVNKCDAAVAIFWTRFGSPTEEYGSGTEEEIEIMLESGKQVFMYFSDKPISPSEMNDEGYKQIQAFREKYKDRGIYFTYSSDEEFKKLFFAHLSMHFLSDKKARGTLSERCSELKLLGIDESGKLSEDASEYPFVLNAEPLMGEYIDSILAMCREIIGMNPGKRCAPEETPFARIDFTKPVDIDEEEREFIATAADQLGMELPDHFFDLGNLSENIIPSSVFGARDLSGTPNEIEKYRKIKKLHKTISDALEWAPVEKAFSDKRCLRLAVQNCGSAIDEDVEITLTLPKKTLLTLDEFPRFKNSEMGYLLNSCEMDRLFGIESTAEYIEYSESQRRGNIHSHYGVPDYGLPGYVPDYSDDFVAELNNVFCYSVYPNEDNFILKLKVDYIKHNTTVAFPSILFVKDEIREIPYKITSKNNPEIVKGTLKIKDSGIKSGEACD